MTARPRLGFWLNLVQESSSLLPLPRHLNTERRSVSPLHYAFRLVWNVVVVYLVVLSFFVPQGCNGSELLEGGICDVSIRDTVCTTGSHPRFHVAPRSSTFVCPDTLSSTVPMLVNLYDISVHGRSDVSQLLNYVLGFLKQTRNPQNQYPWSLAIVCCLLNRRRPNWDEQGLGCMSFQSRISDWATQTCSSSLQDAKRS
jgi:hypothetical protein